jgi:hypothetical protein
MATSEEHVAQAVDEVLDPAWPDERRRALWRWSYATIGRVAAGLLGLWALGFVMHLMVGLTLPWVFYGFMAVMMIMAAFSQEEGREHLRRESGALGRR